MTYIQIKRTITEFVHELRYLAASLSDESSLPEVTRVTVFMNGLNACAARTQVFRTYPHTFEEAVCAALSEKFSHTLASSSSGHSYDMEVSYVAPVATPVGSDRKCFHYSPPGHFARSCPKPRRQDGRGGDRPRDRSNRGRGACAPSRPQGNVRTQ